MGQRFLIIGLVLIGLILAYNGCNYLISPKTKSSKTIESTLIDSTEKKIKPKKTNPYATRSTENMYLKESKYQDYMVALIDSVEIDLKRRFKGQIPQKAIDAISIRDNEIIVSALESLLNSQLQYLIRSTHIRFEVLDSVNTYKYQNNRDYKINIDNQIIYLE